MAPNFFTIETWQWFLVVEPADWFLFITHFFPVTELGSLIANTCLNLSRIGNFLNGIMECWNSGLGLKSRMAQPSRGPLQGQRMQHWTPCCWISPPSQSPQVVSVVYLQVVSVWPPAMMPSYAFFLPVFKGAAINSLARREMSHSHIAEVGEWEGLQDKELWRLKGNRGETRCNY